MKNTDRFLIGIVCGILILILAAFAITIIRPGVAYQADDSPGNITHNYLLAFEQLDFARAYSYLSPGLEGYPHDLEKFIQNVQNNRWNFGYNRDHTLVIESEQTTGNFSIVRVRETTFYNSGILASQTSTNQFTMKLWKTQEGWKLTGGEKYFLACWSKLSSYCR